MKVIPPLTITPATSTVAEPAAGETAWVSGQPYAAGDVVIRTGTHRKYECRLPITSATPPEGDATHWRDAGPTNKYAMFDLRSSAQTEMVAAPLVVEVTPGRRADSIGLRGLHGASVRIEQYVGATQTHDETINLLLRQTTTWKQYFYGDFRVLNAVVRFDLPLSSGATIKITIAPTAGYARCGAIVIGMVEDLGTIVDEPVSDEISLSRVDRESIEGVVSMTKRRTVPTASHRVLAPAARLNRLRELRQQLDAAPALFSGVDDRESSHFFDTLLVLGFPRKWSIALRAQSVVSDIQLEEL